MPGPKHEAGETSARDICLGDELYARRMGESRCYSRVVKCSDPLPDTLVIDRVAKVSVRELTCFDILHYMSGL